MHSSIRNSIKVIINRLFEAEDRRLEVRMAQLGRMNAEALGVKTINFMFKGKVFQPKVSGTMPVKGRVPTLAFQLQAEGNDFIKDFNAISHDRKMIDQFLVKMTYNCTTTQEFRDTIPEVLLGFAPEFNSIERRFGENYFAPKDERFQRELATMLPKIEFYSVTRLIY